MYGGLKKRKTFEELIVDLQNFDKLIKYPNRTGTFTQQWIGAINSNITSPVNYADEHIKKLLKDQAVQTALKELEDKETQTDINHKEVQVQVIPNLTRYFKMLGPYASPDVVDHSGWFSRRKKRRRRKR